MSKTRRRTSRLDILEARLTGPKRVALFGHRNVGKTTLLAMFYREASSGRMRRTADGGGRPAECRVSGREDRPDRVGRADGRARWPRPSSRLRLYHGPARFELIVKDYQGEDVTLGSEQPIKQFFADCHAVLLCLDPEGSADATERRRRQQEVENLLEGYVDRSDDGKVGRPVALLLTKFDRVLAGWHAPRTPERGSGVPVELVERLLNERYGMTRHALAAHAPDGAVFAVSSFGAQALREIARRPSFIRWGSRAHSAGWPSSSKPAIAPIWSCSGSWHRAMSRACGRCLAVYEKRYPRSNRSFEFRERLEEAREEARLAADLPLRRRGHRRRGRAGRLGRAGIRAREVVRDSGRGSAGGRTAMV